MKSLQNKGKPMMKTIKTINIGGQDSGAENNQREKEQVLKKPVSPQPIKTFQPLKPHIDNAEEESYMNQEEDAMVRKPKVPSPIKNFQVPRETNIQAEEPMKNSSEDKSVHQQPKTPLYQSAIKVSTEPEKKNISDSHSLMSVTDFYCQCYELIKEIIDVVLTTKYGFEVGRGTEDETIRNKIENEATDDVREYLASKNVDKLDYAIMSDYVHLIFCEAMGFGILDFLLNDKEIDEIMVQKHDVIYAEKHGIPVLTEYKFPSFDAALGIVNRIIRPLNKTLDISRPNVDGQLPNGSRISASIPPLRAEGEISITIRKFSEKVEPLITYAEKYHSSTPEMVKFIESCVTARKTIVVSGGTGSGKTTLLNSLSFAIDKNERILVIEDTREIHCQVPHTEYYLKVDGNSEGYKGISIADIIQMALRKRPDRILVGECRGPEMNEYINAANTGHEGSMTSVHSNNPPQLFSRMENMLLKNEETKNMTHEAIMRILAASVDIIVQTKRLADGSRRITNVTEVLGYGQEGYEKLRKMKLVKDNEPCNETKIYMRDVFYFKEIDTEEKIVDGVRRIHVKGQFLATGYIPYCNRELKRKGLGFDNDFFNKRVLLEV